MISLDTHCRLCGGIVYRDVTSHPSWGSNTLRIGYCCINCSVTFQNPETFFVADDAQAQSPIKQITPQMLMEDSKLYPRHDGMRERTLLSGIFLDHKACLDYADKLIAKRGDWMTEEAKELLEQRIRELKDDQKEAREIGERIRGNIGNPDLKKL